MIAKAETTWNEGLTAKEQCTVEGYCNPDSKTYNNWGQSYLKAGYSECKGYERNALKVRSKNHVSKAIADYRARTGQIWEHDRKIAVDALNINMLRLQIKADNGDVQACTAITGIIRELNSISALHSQTVNTGNTQPIELTEQEKAQARAAAEALTKPTLVKDTA